LRVSLKFPKTRENVFLFLFPFAYSPSYPPTTVHLHVIISFPADESYSKLLLEEGNETPVDEDSKYIMELPEWADERKIRMYVN
jgi:hypothetical protein